MPSQKQQAESKPAKSQQPSPKTSSPKLSPPSKGVVALAKRLVDVNAKVLKQASEQQSQDN
jgi:hypothetical protein